MLIATFEAFRRPTMAVTLELNVQVSILFLIAGMVALTLSSSSAAVRHRIWSLVFCSLFVMPALSAVVPRWTIPVTATQVTEPVHGQHDTATPLLDARQILELEPPATGTLPTAIEPATVVKKSSIQPSSVDRRRSFDAAKWLMFIVPIIWALGFIAVIGQLLRSQFYKRRLQNHSRIVDDEDWNVLLKAVMLQLRIRRRVRLYQSQEENIPVTWDVLRPLIMLPVSSTNWSELRRRYVLTHELSHIQRCDLPFQLVAHLCCAFFWFNPLVWYGYWRLCNECEQACDDSVVQQGSSASDYAAELVRLAKELCTAKVHSAVAMTRTTNLERRIKALFDRTKSHLPLSGSARVATSIAVMTLVLLTTMMRPALRTVAADEPSKADQASASATDKAPAGEQTSKRSSPNPLVRILQPVPKNVRVDLSGDPMPEGMIQRLGGTRFKVRGWWRELAFAANDEWIWLKAHDKVSVIHRETGRIVNQQELRLGNGLASHLSISGDGNLVAIDMSERQVDADNQFNHRIAIISTLTTGRHCEVKWKSSRTLYSICLSHDGQLLLTASSGGLCLWNVETGKLLRREEVQGSRDSAFAAIARDGKMAIIGAENFVMIWNFEQTPSMTQRRVPQGTSTCLAPNDKMFATLSRNEVRVWDTTSCNVIASLERNQGDRFNADFGFSFSPDSKLLAVPVAAEHAVELWNVELTECVKRFPVDRPRGAVFSRDGRWLAAAGDNNITTIIDLQTDKQVNQPSVGHDDVLWSVCFVDAGSLVSSCTDARVWDLKSATQQRILAHNNDGALQQVDVSPDGKRIVTLGSRSIGVWESSTGAQLLTIPTPEGFQNSRLVQFNADGSQFATWGGNDAKLRWWNVTDGENTATLGIDDPALKPDQARGGGRLAGGRRSGGLIFVQALTRERLFVVSGSNLLEFDAISGERRRTEPLKNQVWALAASLDGRWLATSEEGRLDGHQFCVVLRDQKTMEIIREWPVIGPEEPLPLSEVAPNVPQFSRVLQGSKGVVFSPDSKHLAWTRAGKQFGIDVVNVAQDSLVAKIPLASECRCLAFSPDSSQLASGHVDSTISVWDLGGGGAAPGQ